MKFARNKMTAARILKIKTVIEPPEVVEVEDMKRLILQTPKPTAAIIPRPGKAIKSIRF
jgi:hypothetical protein